MRLAIVGYGNIARKHIEVFRALGIEVIAVCNRSRNSIDLAKKQDRIKKGYLDPTKMIDKEKPDALLISVSYWNAFEVAKSLIPLGIPILMEKPSATSLEDHIYLTNLAKEYGTYVQVGLNRRHYSILEKALNKIGGEDKINQFIVEWGESPNHLLKNRGLLPDQIEKIIFGNSIHGLDIITYLTGPLEKINIYGKCGDQPFAWDMNFTGLTEKGALVTFNNSFTAPVRWRVRLLFKNGSATFAPLEECVIDCDGKSEKFKPDKVDQDFKTGFYAQAKYFYDNYNMIGTHKHDLESVRPAMNLAQQLTDQFIKNKNLKLSI